MPWLNVIWDDSEGGNVQHIAGHGISQDEVEHVLQNPQERGVSRSSARPFIVGITPAGRAVLVVYEVIDDMTVYPITAYAMGQE